MNLGAHMCSMIYEICKEKDISESDIEDKYSMTSEELYSFLQGKYLGEQQKLEKLLEIAKAEIQIKSIPSYMGEEEFSKLKEYLAEQVPNDDQTLMAYDILRAKTMEELIDLIKSNFHLAVGFGIFQVLFEENEDTGEDGELKNICEAHHLYLNPKLPVTQGYVVVNGYHRATISGDTEVLAYNNAELELSGSVKATCYNNCKVTCTENSKVYAYGNTEVKAFSCSDVHGSDNSKIVAIGDCRVYLYINSNACISDNVIAHIYSKSTCEASGNSVVHCSDNSKVTVNDPDSFVIIHAYKESVVRAVGYTIIHHYSSKSDIEAGGNCIVRSSDIRDTCKLADNAIDYIKSTGEIRKANG